jgi:hypothetical protein
MLTYAEPRRADGLARLREEWALAECAGLQLVVNDRAKRKQEQNRKQKQKQK